MNKILCSTGAIITLKNNRNYRLIKEYAPFLHCDGWNGAVQHLHISDYGGGYKEWAKLASLQVGEGRIDFEELSQNLKDVGYSNAITIESSSIREDGTLRLNELNRSLDYLNNI